MLKTLNHGPAPIIHTDEGANYQHLFGYKLLANAVAENFYGYLKS